MKRFWIFAALTATLAIPGTGHAVVDMKNANYADSWLDMSLGGTGYTLRVQPF